MKIKELHPWPRSLAEAMELQRQLAARVERRGEVGKVELVAGLDISAPNRQGLAKGAVVVVDYPALKMVEVKVKEGKLEFPYIPGLLAFRELPLLLAALSLLKREPQLFLVDGQGVAHPRRFGIACHLGLFLDRPTIGCAKSLLCGNHQPPGEEAGNYREVVDEGEVIGAALRTKKGASPVYVSIGHKVNLEQALFWVMATCHDFRLPEPLRLAHLAATGQLPPTPAGEQGRLF